MSESMIQKARAFDRTGVVRTEMDNAVSLLKQFRKKYPFVENPESIETLSPDDIFKERPDEVGEFFHWLEYYLAPIGHLTLYGSNVYHQIRKQFDEFKELLYIVVDKEKSLVEKVDAPWNGIKHLGGDRHIAKKIIFCFNFETEDILPIFKTDHLKHFISNIVERPQYPANYESLTIGEAYQFLNLEVLGAKKKYAETESWTIPYFARFLYDSFPPTQMDTHAVTKLENRARKEQQTQFQDFITLLNELQRENKISGEEFRLNRKSWEDSPQNRDTLVERLKLLQKKQVKS
jgi:hypothetical protein